MIGVLVLNEPFGVAAAVGMAMILFGSSWATGKQEASRLDAVAGLEHPQIDQARRREQTSCRDLARR